MAKTCSTDSLSMTGPFEQTLFLGCSIVSFTTSLGWDSQNSELTVQLVEDNCVGPKVWWDGAFNKQTASIVDNGFIGETHDIIGCPVYFRLGNFEFCGLVQKWDKENSKSGRPTYSVNVVDPRQLLENSKLIINNYAGGVGSVFNVFNIFGFLESFGVAAPQLSLYNGVYQGGDLYPDGATFGSPAGGFGGALVNDNGMLWRYIVNGLNILANAIPRSVNQWSPYGRITYKAINHSGGGLIPHDRTYLANMGSYMETKHFAEYFLDLSELPTAPTYWRMPGDNISILDFITALCNDAGYNYYIELIPIKNATMLSPSGIAKMIKLRTVKRLSQPDLGSIAEFIGDGSGAISATNGRELRNETTSALCFGGPKETLYQITGDNDVDDTILPYFGLDPWTNNTIIPYKDAYGEWYIYVDTTILNENLNQLGPIGAFGVDVDYDDNFPQTGRRYVKITEFEMMAALGSYDTWHSTVIDLATVKTGISSIGDSILVTGQGMYSVADSLAEIQVSVGLQPGHLLTKDIIRKFQPHLANARAHEELQMIYQWVLGFAENLGKRFQVRVPYTCARIDGDSAQILTSESPSNGGWTEQNVLGLARTSAYLGFFQLENNQISAMIVLQDNTINKDISYLGDTYSILGNYIYIKAQVESEYVYENKLAVTGPRAILNIAGGVPIIDQDVYLQGCRALFAITDKSWNLLDQPENVEPTKTKLRNVFNNVVGSRILYEKMPYYFDTNPVGAACGIKSNIMTYGPWVKLGPVGGTRIEQDTSLVPWEYNGYTNMNLAGQSKADEGVTRMQVGEMGSITVPGYPTIPLGAELGALANGVFGGGTNLIENRISSLTTSSETFGSKLMAYYQSTGGWTGLYGPNITDIRVNVGEGGVQTEYSMRTYTPKFGRFSKQNSDRLKIIGQLQIKAQRAFTQWIGARLQGQLNSQIQYEGRFHRINAKDEGIQIGGHTPHHILAGSMVELGGPTTTNFKNTSVVTNPLLDLHNELSGYANKAFMSLDGLLRPVSLGGSGGLPRLATPVNTGILNSYMSQPPIGYGVTSGYNIPISNIHLQPFQNPNSGSVLRSNTLGIGHDIAIVGKGTVPPSSMMTVGLTGNAMYTGDYRFLALKGPLILQSWGYDTDGRPTPNSADIEANSGIFVTGNLTDKFSDNWLRKPQTWPVAPVDLRYDRYRGMWTSPPPFEWLVGTVSGQLGALTTGTTVINTGRPLYDSAGNEIAYTNNNVKVLAHNKLNVSYNAGDKVYLSYNNRVGEYWAFGGANSLIPFELYDDMTPGGIDKNAWQLNSNLTRNSTANKVLVSDQILGDVRAYGSNHGSTMSGATGLYILGPNNKNQIVAIKRLSKLIRGSGPLSLVAADTSYTLSNIVALDDGQLPGTGISSVTNYSTSFPSGATNITVVADGIGGYRTLDAPCTG